MSYFDYVQNAQTHNNICPNLFFLHNNSSLNLYIFVFHYFIIIRTVSIEINFRKINFCRCLVCRHHLYYLIK